MPRHPGHKARRKQRSANAHSSARQTQEMTPQNRPHWDAILTGRACYQALEADRYAYIDMAYSMGYSGKQIIDLKLMDIHKDADPPRSYEQVTLSKLLSYPKFDKG